MLGFELRANTPSQRRKVARQSPAIHGHPMLRVVESHHHGGVAARSNDSARRRFLVELTAFEEFGARRISDAIFAIENIRCSAVGTENSTGVRQRFNLLGAFLASIAIADDTRHRSAEHVDFHASTRATCRPHIDHYGSGAPVAVSCSVAYRSRTSRPTDEKTGVFSCAESAAAVAQRSKMKNVPGSSVDRNTSYARLPV